MPFEPPSFDAWLGSRWTLPAFPRPAAGAPADPRLAARGSAAPTG
ncbi:hypothetical protein [Blastococcus sp. KM273129]|nr:hypothetical protein [Blastococcus sp. KM273129]